MAANHPFVTLLDPRGQLSTECLIIACVSLGNVAQLASDVLLTTLQMQRVGYLAPSFAVPVIGGLDSATDSNLYGISTPLELFESQDGKFTILHSRSPPLKSRKEAFIRELVNFACRYKRVLVVTSIDASARRDEDVRIACAPFRLSGRAH